uniref:HDC14118 n=2 Tax=melanogaster subgroup TaxID=32351 RepID=Q6IJV6_DROME|nr:TPA_inf: HDC14118 [Drosophila melanogaster]
MKLIILIAFLALLNLAKSQNCNNDCSRIGINFLCGKTVRNGREIRCTYRNPCEMHLHACQKREVPKKCHDVCPMGYRVVCALDVLDGCLRSFASSCVMRMYNCKYQKDYRIIAERACEFISNDELLGMDI